MKNKFSLFQNHFQKANNHNSIKIQHQRKSFRNYQTIDKILKMKMPPVD